VAGTVLLLVAVITVDRVGRRNEPDPIRPTGGPAASTTGPDSLSTPPRSSRSLPLGGVPLHGPTGLRLLVADVPPIVLDLDRGTARRVTGLSTNGDTGVSVFPVGEHALVLAYRLCNACRAAPTAYLVRRGSTAATPLATSLQVVPSRDGEGVWVLSRRGVRRCAIREIGLDGRPLRAARELSCRTGLVAELPAGLLVSYTGPKGTDAHNALVKPDDGVVRLRYDQAQPVVGNLALTGLDRRTPLLLHDTGSGVSQRLRWPGRPDYSLGEVTGGPDGRLAIVEFAKFSPEHMVDMWLLDTATRRWRHLPGMPARLVPKATDVGWTADGRVVILSGGVLGVWRPGEPRLSVRRVKPPKQPGSEFVVW
jgi:hypothetical protein